MIRIVLILGAAAVLSACEDLPTYEAPISNGGRSTAQVNRSAAESRCGPAGINQRPDSDGTSPGDYRCGKN